MGIGVAGMFGNSPRRDVGFVRDFAQAAEGLGFHSLSVPEHVVFFPSYASSYPYTEDGSTNWGPETGIYDPLIVCAAAAAATTTLRLITGVLILPQRPALLTAKEALTLDHFSGGRFELGVGSGWSWEEYGALGVPFERRGKRFDEYIEAMRVAWTTDQASYHGEYVEFDDVVLNPKPLHGTVPVIIGGDSPAAMRRAARLGDGWYGWWADNVVTGPLTDHLDKVHAALAEHDRAVTDDDFSFKLGLPLAAESPDEIAAKAAEARAAGVEELILAGPVPASGFEAALTTYAEACGIR